MSWKEMLASPKVCVAVRFRPTKDGGAGDNDGDELLRGNVVEHSYIDYDDHSVNVTESTAAANAQFPTAAPIRSSTMCFTFDAVLPEAATQQEVYDRIGAPVVARVLKGYNSTLFAYGQSGSGKTHSMFGPAGGTKDVFSPDSSEYAARGLVPRILEELFESLVRLNPLEFSWHLTATMFEIYRESIIDLLRRDPPEPGHRIRDDTPDNKKLYIDSLEQVECRSATQVLELLSGGMLRRHTSATSVNDTSSRGHLLMCLVLKQNDLIAGGAVTSTRLNLVDLAGSEKISRTLEEGDKLKEAQCINTSLALLGNVIRRLAGGNSGHIPYRNSKLTQILQESLGENPLTTLLCHGSVAAVDLDETLSTLRFAHRVKCVRNRSRASRELGPQGLYVQLACAPDKTPQLDEKIQLQNEVIGAHQVTLQTPTDPGEVERLNSLVSSLGKELEEIKERLSAREMELQRQRKSLEFYKQQCLELRGLLDRCGKHEGVENQLFSTFRLTDDGQESLKEISPLELDLYSEMHNVWKPLAPLDFTNSMTLEEDCKGGDGTDEVETTIGHHAPSPRLLVVVPIPPRADSQPPIAVPGCRRHCHYSYSFDSSQSSRCDTTKRSVGSQPSGVGLHEGRLDLTSSHELRGSVVQGISNPTAVQGVVYENRVFSSLLQSLQAIHFIIPPLVAPDILEIHLYRALRVVCDVLHTVNRQQSPMPILQSFNLAWERASASAEFPEAIVADDVLLATLYVARDVLEIGTRSMEISAADVDTVMGIGGFSDNDLLLSVLTALRNISRLQGKAVLAKLVTAEVVRAMDTMESHVSRCNMVMNDSTEMATYSREEEVEEEVLVVAAARTVLNEALGHVVATIGAEMLVLFRERLRSGLTLDEMMLACRLVEDQVSALRGTANVRVEMLREKPCNAMEVIQGVIRILSVSRRLETLKSAAAAVEQLTSDEMVQSVHILRNHATLASDADADMLAVYHTEELREALLELQLALSTCTHGAHIEEEDACMPQNEVQRAFWTIARHTAALENAHNKLGAVTRLFTPVALHALGVVACLMDGAADMYASRCGGTVSPLDEGGVAVLRNASVALEAFIQVALPVVAAGGGNRMQQTQESGKRGRQEAITVIPVTEAVGMRVRPPSSELPWATALVVAERVLRALVCKMSRHPGSLTAEERRVVMALNSIASLVEGEKTSTLICEPLDPVAKGASSAILPPLIVKGVAAMTDEDFRVAPLNACDYRQGLQQQRTLLNDKSIQTEECLADIAACMELFLGARVILSEEGVTSSGEAVELLSTISRMQRQLSYMQRVREPVLQRELVQQQQELREVRGALETIQWLMQVHRPPFFGSSSENEWNYMPLTLRHGVNSEMPLMTRRSNSSSSSSSSPLRHVFLSSQNHLGGGKLSCPESCKEVTTATGSAAFTAHQVAEDVSVWFRNLVAVYTRVVQHDKKTSAYAAKLEEERNALLRERDSYRDGVTALDDAISMLRNENRMIRELLSTLYLDLDKYVERVEVQSAANARLQAETTALKGAAADLRRNADQLELCEMVETELRMKREDFETIEAEARQLCTLCDTDLVKRKRKLLQHAFRGLLKSVQRILDKLHQQQCFDTDTLESQRLFLLNSLIVFTREVEDALESLQPVD